MIAATDLAVQIARPLPRRLSAQAAAPGTQHHRPTTWPKTTACSSTTRPGLGGGQRLLARHASLASSLPARGGASSSIPRSCRVGHRHLRRPLPGAQRRDRRTRDGTGSHHYGVQRIYGFRNGYQGFVAAGTATTCWT